MLITSLVTNKLFLCIFDFHIWVQTKYWLLCFTLLSIGGYNLVKTRQGKGVCISLATAYNDVFMETYNLELNLKSKLTIGRHDIPPFIPLKKLEGENNLQTDLRSFLDTLSQHLNAYVGRKEQLRLVKVSVLVLFSSWHFVLHITIQVTNTSSFLFQYSDTSNNILQLEWRGVSLLLYRCFKKLWRWWRVTFCVRSWCWCWLFHAYGRSFSARWTTLTTPVVFPKESVLSVKVGLGWSCKKKKS